MPSNLNIQHLTPLVHLPDGASENLLDDQHDGLPAVILLLCHSILSTEQECTCMCSGLRSTLAACQQAWYASSNDPVQQASLPCQLWADNSHSISDYLDDQCSMGYEGPCAAYAPQGMASQVQAAG